MGSETDNHLWYTRRGGDTVRGPYPERQVSRYILLGRIRESDELSTDRENWRLVADCPELIPEVMRHLETEEDFQRLLIARMREDERSPHDRRASSPGQPPRERRASGDRREPEPEPVVRHRVARGRLLDAGAGYRERDLWPGMLLVAVMLGMGLLFARYTHQATTGDGTMECTAAPRPGINWNNCQLVGVTAAGAALTGAHIYNANLTGAHLQGAHLEAADLAYSTLSMADLAHADLRDARLTGAGLQGTDLRDADLEGADLSYAMLTGANITGVNLKGAHLDNAIWIDNRICARGSVGRCVLR